MRVWATRVAQALGIARINRVAWLLFAAVGASLAGGFWAGADYQAGREARAELARVQELERVHAAETARWREIAQSYEELDAIAKVVAERSAEQLRGYLAQRPDLADCGIGADGLLLWNSWRLPPGRRAGEPAATVPGDAADGAQ